VAYIAAPGVVISVYAQFNDTGGSANDATTPVVRAISYDADTSKHVDIAGSPYNMVNVPEDDVETGWYAARVTVPAEATIGEIIGLRFYGACDSQTPASEDHIIVRNHEYEESASGENEVTINLTCDDVGVINERIIVRNGEGTILAAGYTDSEPAGEFICQLDDGTYYVRYGPTSSYEYSNDYTLVVSGETEEDYTCTGLVFPECGLTLAQMKSQVITALLDVYPDRMTDSLVEKWVEQGALTLDAALKWTRDIAEITTVAETAEYALESSSRNIVAVVYDDDGVLEHQEFGEHLSRIDGGGASGTPAYWSIWGGYIYLYPVPSASDITVSAYILKAPAPLAGDDVKPALPCELHTLIVDYAMFRAYTHLSDTRSATIYYGLFKDGIASFRADVSAHRTGRTHMVDVDDL